MNIFNKGLLDIFILAMLWGPSALFIKISVNDVTPITLATLRISIGVLLLYAILRLKKMRLPNDPILWGHCFILGFLVNGLPFISFNYALMNMPSSLCALINGITPVITILLANLFLKDEPLTLNHGVGVGVGLLGFFILFLPFLLGISIELEIRGVILSFVGVTSCAVGMVYARKYVHDTPVFLTPIMQLSTSLCYLIPLAFVFESPILIIQQASLPAWGGILSLAILGTALAYVLYYRILVKQGVTALSIVTYLLPILGTILGVVFLEEEVGIHFVIATVLILCSVMLVNETITLPRLMIKKT